METAGCIHPRECEAAPTTNNLARLPFDLLVEVAARVSAPKDISSLLQASRVTSSLKSSPQLLSRWLLTHRPSTSALVAAAAAGLPAAVRSIIDNAIRSDLSIDGLNLRGESGAQALCVAAAHGHVGVLQLLLAAGAPANGAQHTATNVTLHGGQPHQEGNHTMEDAQPVLVAAHLTTPAPLAGTTAVGPASAAQALQALLSIIHTLPLAAAASRGHLQCVRVLLEGVPLASCLRNTHPNPSDHPCTAESGPKKRHSSIAPVAHQGAQQALLTTATPSAEAAEGGTAQHGVTAHGGAPPKTCHPIFSLAIDSRPTHARTEQEEAGWLPPQRDADTEQQQQQQVLVVLAAQELQEQGLCQQQQQQQQQQPQPQQLQPAIAVSFVPHKPTCLQGEGTQGAPSAGCPTPHKMQGGGSTSSQREGSTSMQGGGSTSEQLLNQPRVGSTTTQPLNPPRLNPPRLNQARVGYAGQAALLAAAHCGQVHCIGLLLSWGADAKVQDGEALCLAAAGGHVASMAVLLEAGCAVDAQDGRPLVAAASGGHMQAVIALWEAGAQSGPNRAFSLASALVGAAGGGHEAVVKALLGWGASAESQEGAALQSAAASGHLAVCQYLLAAGADAWAHDSAALCGAVEAGHASVVELLLEAGADAGAANQAPIREAARIGHITILRLLLQHGADAHCMDESPLRTAASAGAVDVVEELLRTTSADVHANEDEALLWATDNGHVDVVQLLLQYGATPNEHALWCAIARGHQHIVTILMDQGTSLLRVDQDVGKGPGSEQQTS